MQLRRRACFTSALRRRRIKEQYWANEHGDFPFNARYLALLISPNVAESQIRPRETQLEMFVGRQMTGDCETRDKGFKMARTYLNKDAYSHLIETLLTVPALLKVKPSPWSGTITAHEISAALGSKADIWPACDRKR